MTIFKARKFDKKMAIHLLRERLNLSCLLPFIIIIIIIIISLGASRRIRPFIRPFIECKKHVVVKVPVK